ncbi:hypothetical protein [Beijerinckia mobilis]|uniref:hypothetical protein n=1 Tax=Beijerinckia mobilis TaxID=231434 RepID=UPI0012EB371F|nr:hypothetical protein [Beijerinckia mobilis]
MTFYQYTDEWTDLGTGKIRIHTNEWLFATIRNNTPRDSDSNYATELTGFNNNWKFAEDSQNSFIIKPYEIDQKAFEIATPLHLYIKPIKPLDTNEFAVMVDSNIQPNGQNSCYITLTSFDYSLFNLQETPVSDTTTINTHNFQDRTITTSLKNLTTNAITTFKRIIYGGSTSETITYTDSTGLGCVSA